MIRQEEDGVWLVLEEIIGAHHEEIFGALTTATGLRQWFPLDAEVDLRTGGHVTFAWDKDFRKTTTVAILDYDPGGRIVWDWIVSHGDTHAPIYWGVEPMLDRGSKVTFRQGPYREDIDSMKAMASEASSWMWYICNLRSLSEAKLDMRKHRPL